MWGQLAGMGLGMGGGAALSKFLPNSALAQFLGGAAPMAGMLAGGMAGSAMDASQNQPPPPTEPEVYGYMSGGRGGPGMQIVDTYGPQLERWKAQQQNRDQLNQSLGMGTYGLASLLGQSGGGGNPGSWLGNDQTRNTMLGGNNQPYGFFDPSLYGKPGFGF